MKTRLSYSSITEYQDCSMKFYLNRVLRLRPTHARTALLFGSALDKGLNHLLETKNLDESKEKFVDAWSEGEINGEMVDLENSELVLYSKSDFDPDLADSPWECLLKKGYMFLEAYNTEILPRIKEVLEVQGESIIKNEEGDELVMKRDLVALMDDGKHYLLDNKSSTGLYPANAAEEATQLMLYYYGIKDKYRLDGVGYLVLNKTLTKTKVLYCHQCQVELYNNRLKKCPTCKEGLDFIKFDYKVQTQILLNSNINDKYVDMAVEKVDQANQGISNEIYAKTEDRSKCHAYGGCPYKLYCWGNGDTIGLTTVEKK